MADQIRVNGNEVSWGSIVFKVDGERYWGFDSISFGDKRERVKVYGMGKHQVPRSRTRGKYSTDPVKVRGPKTSVQALREQLAAKASDGVSYGNVECMIVVQYIEEGQQSITAQLERSVWVGNTTGDEESGDPMREEFELDTMLIRRNGLVLFDATSGTP